MVLTKKNSLAICKKHFPNCKVESFREITEAGLLNPIYEIIISNPNKKLVLKTYGKGENYKPDKEKRAFDLIKEKTHLPVPEVYSIDKTKKIINKNYLLMEKITGKMLRDLKLSKKEKKKMYYHLGWDLAKLHAINFTHFGVFHGAKVSKHEDTYEKPYEKWKDYFLDKYAQSKKEFLESENRVLGKISKKDFEEFIPKIDAYFEKNINILDENIKPSFIHGDYSMTNILLKKDRYWKISGILDLEFSLITDSEFELSYMGLFMLPLYKKSDLNITNYGKEFFKGYKKAGGKLSQNFKEKRILYLLYSAFSIGTFSVFVARKAPEKIAKKYYYALKRLLK